MPDLLPWAVVGVLHRHRWLSAVEISRHLGWADVDSVNRALLHLIDQRWVESHQLHGAVKYSTR